MSAPPGSKKCMVRTVSRLAIVSLITFFCITHIATHCNYSVPPKQSLGLIKWGYAKANKVLCVHR